MRPLLVEKCWTCHGTAAKTKGGLRLTSRASVLAGGDSGPAAIAGDPAASLIIQAIRYEQEPKMPPVGKLTDREILVLSSWVAKGLPWPDAKNSATAVVAAGSARRPTDRETAPFLVDPARQADGRSGRA